ncbi:DUF4159 domain-containing protein [Paludibaculum fermentans]|uniref:DUF4159 domain-containing protein n=1 Tax=Paludibaculum fermentans TaxID=1473598 RepID=UPI003EBFCAA6
MNLRTVRWLLALGILGVGLVCAYQKPFREFPGFENENDPLPSDYAEKSEWVFARLMYPPVGGFRFRRGGGDWSQGNSFWTMDYPRADRHFARALRRLTRIHVRSVEQPVNLDEGDDVFNWPWMYGVEVGHWNLTDAQVVKMREYLLRGGFFMCDDFHGTREWAIFAESMQRVFPDRPIVEIESRDPIFHILYDLDERYQIPGEQFVESGRTYERDGYEPHWRGIYDDKGRLMVAICFNMDIGDSLEWADVPAYPEKYSALGIRIAANYVVYSMTH